MVWTWQKQKILKRGGKNTEKNCTKKDLHDPVTKGQRLYDSIYMRHLRVINILETESRLVTRVWGRENEELMFKGCRVSVWQDEKSYENGWWWLHNIILVLNATELCTSNGYDGKFQVLCILSQVFKWKKKREWTGVHQDKTVRQVIQVEGIACTGVIGMN